MTDIKVTNLHILCKTISDYLMDIAVGVDSIEYDENVMTDDDKKEIYEGMLPLVYKMGKAVADLEKEIKGGVE